MYTRSDAGTGDGREGATGHGIGTAILEARSGVGSSANNDVAAASRSHRSFSSFSCLFFSLARFTGPGASVREVGGTDSASSGAVVHGVDHAIVKSSRHRYGAQPTSRLAHPLPSRPQCSVNPLGASENGSLLTAGVRGSRRHHIAHKDAPPKQRAFVSMATATTGPRVDLAATQKDVCAHSPSHRGSSASCIDEPHTSLSTAPCATIGAASAGASSAGLTATATSLENGCTNSSQLRAVAKLAKASSGLKCDAGDARSGSGSGNTVPQHERGHAPGRGSSSPSSRALNGSHHPHRYRKPHTEEHKRGKSADSRGRLQKVKVTADVRADQLKFSRHPDQPCITQFSGLAAEPTAPPRCVSTCDVAFEASSRRAPTPDHAKAFRPTARKSVVEGSHSTLTTSSRRHVTAQERCTDDLKPSPSTTPGSPKALAASMPTVRFIYTNRRSRSNDGSEKKPTYRSVSAAKNTLGDDICAVVCASTESTPSAVKVVERTEERAAASTPIASAPLPRSTQLILRRGTQPKRNTKGTHRRPSVRDPFARSLTYSGVYTQEAREAAQLTSEGRGRQEDQKRRIASKDAEHATDSVLRRASTNDFEDVSYSYLQRWRQRQEKNRSNRKDVISMSTSTSSTVEEGATTLTDVLGKNKAFATSNEEEAKSLPSDSATGTPFRGEGKNDISSAKSATSAHTGLAVAPQRVTKVRERQCRGSATAEARNSANAPTVSGPFILSDVSHSDAIPRAPEATLAPVLSKRNAKASTALHPEPRPTVQSKTMVDGSAEAAVTKYEVRAESNADLSTNPPLSRSSSCHLPGDPVYRVTSKGGSLVDQEAASSPSSAQRTCYSGGVSEMADGVTRAKRRPSDRTSVHKAAHYQATQGPTATAAKDVVPFLSPSAADTRELFRSVLERRGRRLQLQEYLKNASSACLQQSSSIEAPSGTSSVEEMLPVFSSLEQPSTRCTPVTSSPCTTQRALTQGTAVPAPWKAEPTRSSELAGRTVAPEGADVPCITSVVSPPAGSDAGKKALRTSNGAATEPHAESFLSAKRKDRYLRSSFSTTEVPGEKASQGLKSLESSKGEEVLERPPASGTSSAYSPLVRWMRQSRTQLSLPTSGASTPLQAVDVAGGCAARLAAPEVEENSCVADRRGLVKKCHRPSTTASSTVVDNNEAQRPDTDASRYAFNDSCLRRSSEACGSLRCSSTNSSLCISSFDKAMMSEKHRTLATEHPSRPGTAEGPGVPVTEGELPPPAPASTVAEDTKGAFTRTITCLSDIPVDDLGTLEQSINALLRNYGPRKTPEEGSTVAKVTAADALMREMAPPAKTSTKTKATEKKSMASIQTNKTSTSKNATVALSHTQEGHLRLRSGCLMESEDDDSQLEASALWCGDEDAHEAKPPPLFVPPLDLTMLLLPTGDSEDLKPYRIPLPSAVPAPDEAHRRFLCSIGAYAAAFGEEDHMVTADISIHGSAAADGASASVSMTGIGDAAPPRGNSPSVDGSCVPPSRRVSKSATPFEDISPFVNERIRRMRASRQPFSSTGTSTMSLHSWRASRNASGAVKGSTDQDSSERVKTDNVLLMEKTADATLTGEERELNSSSGANHVLPHGVRVVLFTDDSDALDGGRGAERDRRVNVQRGRVQRILLDCKEQRQRKSTVLEESNAFKELIKRFERSVR